MPSGSTPSATRPYRAFGNLDLSNFLVFCFCLLETRFYSEYFFIPHNSSSSGVATSMGTAAPAVGTTAVTVAPGLAVGGLPQTPKGVPEDVLEEVEEEPEMVLELVPEVVLVEGAMITVRAAAPSPPCGASAASSLVPRAVAVAGATSNAMVGLEVILGHPTLYATDDIPLDEAVSTAHRALSQMQLLLRQEGEGLADERQRL
jgi:hypothetical protein